MLPSDESGDIDDVVTPRDTAYIILCFQFCKRVSTPSPLLDTYYDDLRTGVLMLEHALLMTSAVSNLSRVNKIAILVEILSHPPFYAYFVKTHNKEIPFTSLVQLGKVLNMSFADKDHAASSSRKRKHTVPRMPDIMPDPSLLTVYTCARVLIENKKLPNWREAGGVILDYMEKLHFHNAQKQPIACDASFPQYCNLVPVLIGMCNNMTYKQTFDERITAEMRTLPFVHAWKSRLLSKNETMYRLIQTILDSDPLTSNKTITAVIDSPFVKAPGKMLRTHSITTFIKLCVLLIEKTARSARATSNIMETDYYTHVINPSVRHHRSRRHIEETRLPTLYYDFRESMYGYVYKGVFYHHRHPLICISAWLACCMTVPSVPDTLKDLNDIVSAAQIDEQSSLSENQYFCYLKTHDKAVRV